MLSEKSKKLVEPEPDGGLRFSDLRLEEVHRWEDEDVAHRKVLNNLAAIQRKLFSLGYEALTVPLLGDLPKSVPFAVKTYKHSLTGEKILLRLLGDYYEIYTLKK